jgi:hypothetical protein
MGADTDVARKARVRRLWSTAAWWIFVGVFVYNAVGLGQAFFWIPAVLFGVAAVATTRLALSRTAPERFAPRPGGRAGATPRPGRLGVANGRISFHTLDDEVRFDAPVAQVHLPFRPSFSRPMLEVDIAEARHLVRLFPVWDLGATFVGPVVVGEWYDQLRELGATAPD